MVSFRAKRFSIVSTILIFGDSTVDTGNNNFISTIFKAIYSPYGEDFPGHIATGRFSDGKFIPDMVVSKLGIKELVPPFLDPKLSDDDVKTGVSFAFAGTGYDDLTASVLICSKTTFKGFKGLWVWMKEIYRLGCRTIVVAGLPPVGYLPIQESIAFQNPQDRKCLEDQNLDPQAYNQKLSKLLGNSQPQLPGSTILYADIYTPLIDMVKNPHNYGLEQLNVGCCGTGLAEAGPLCNNETTTTCENQSKLMFWDSIHPTEAAYKLITESLLKQFVDHLNRN
ncbi:unnamed protein product [Citrullus colocynthis]|uniref:GDSL esterase/lipase n=1 Tax=Citrullus colocynthis TaxID=252529 RepID=A0ABP0Y6T6_9ROSI